MFEFKLQSFPPAFAVEGAVGYGFGEVGWGYLVAGFEVGYGSCYTEDAVVGSCGEA